MKTQLLVMLVLAASTTLSQTIPQQEWNAYNSVVEAGFSEQRLATAKSYYDSINFGAALVIHRGAVVASWGENTRRFMLASMRKSLMNAMIGRAIDEGRFDLQTTLSELDINDKTSLTNTERSATIEHLLTTTSGIYLPSAFEYQGWKDRKPERGSHQPGEMWYYNNWDFNALCAIYNQTTGKDFFEAFQNEVADPIGMQDLRDIDGLYYYEPESEHPAYLLKMSSRDLGRFGLLYLNKGHWNNQQLVPASWVAASTQSQVTAFENQGYGYLWWPREISGHAAYSARGAGRHTLTVIPDMDLVMVVRTNDYSGRPLQGRENEQLEELIVNAATEKVARKPRLLPMTWKQTKAPKVVPGLPINPDIVGEYQHPIFGLMTVEWNDSKLTLLGKPARFNMISTGNYFYFIEDAGLTTTFIETDDPNLIGKILMKRLDGKHVLVFHYSSKKSH
ncbi:MAG: serine hydrolase [Cyclobacteriaceae bacterium]